MQPKQQVEPQATNKATLKLLDDDIDLERISNLDTEKMQQMKQVTHDKSKKNRGSLGTAGSNGIEVLDFDEQLNLDMLIEKLLETLTKTKIELMEIDDPGLILENQQTTKFKEYFLGELKKYHKTLLLRQSQLGSLVYVIENKFNQNFESNYLATYGQLEKFIIQPSQTKRPINTVILEQAFETEIDFLKQYSEMITLFKTNITDKKYLSNLGSLQRIASRLKIINSKIAAIAELFPYACVMDKTDLFSFRKTTPRWHDLFESGLITYKIYGDKESLKKSFTKLKGGLNIVNATMSIIHETRAAWAGTAKDWAKDLGNLAGSTSKIFKILLWEEDATHQAQVLFSDPDQALAKQIWNLPEQKMLRNIINTVMPSISFSQEFYIPRICQEFLQKKGQIAIPTAVIDSISSYTKALLQPKQYEERLPMRINSPYTMIYRMEKQQVKTKGIFDSIVQTFQGIKSGDAPTSIIYHIHGGGFISMSSYIHQIYTRVWANNLKVPIISVDYGKAPEHPFPQGLYDCFEGYMWTLYCYRQVFNAEPHKIILVGDSAGGNLVAALTNMLLKMNVRVPDGLVMVYPALNLNYHNYTPSLLTALNDMILPHSFLKICLKAYLKQNCDPFDPYVSPVYTPEDMLKKYPPTRIFVGNRDPFHDDCCRLTEKLNNIEKGKAKLMIFDQFPHGFLQFDVKTQPHEQARKATKQIQNSLRELLDL